jgi:hypothetical protein
MDTFPPNNPTAPAWLLLDATARLAPNDVCASLVPVFTNGIPRTEIARSRGLIRWVVLGSVDVGLVSAHAGAVSTASASSGAPATGQPTRPRRALNRLSDSAIQLAQLAQLVQRSSER